MFSWLKEKYHIMRWKQLKRCIRHDNKRDYYPYIKDTYEVLRGNEMKFVVELERKGKFVDSSDQDVMDKYLEWLAKEWGIYAKIHDGSTHLL